MSDLKFEILSEKYLSEIVNLGQKLNPEKTIQELKILQKEMFQLPAYKCFGLFLEGKLIGISSGWITVRLYSGKQLEVDNVIIDNDIQSKGYGKHFFKFIEEWGKENKCKSIELNTYVQNSRSHKFYYNLGFSILGFHFWKSIA
jgi:GNAT superfamily N-acetyltransferase